MPSAIGMARGIAHFLTKGGDAGVTREREEQQARRLQHAADAAAVETRCRHPPVTGSEQRHHDRGQHHQHDRHDDPVEHGRLLDACVVDRGEHDDRCHGDRVRVRGPGVDADRERHRRARGRLADDEAPAGCVTPERAESLAAVDVGSPRLRVERRKPRRRRRVAVGDDGRDAEADEQARTRRGRRGGQNDEDAGADHRAEPDRHGVRETEAPLQRGLLRRAHRR
jgi:hypothetical protein